MNKSGAAGATFGNIVLGGGIGWAIDSATGSDNKYDSPVNLSLVPLYGAAAAAPTAAATPIAPPAAATVTDSPPVPVASASEEPATPAGPDFPVARR
jgi:hypothetical protein